MGGSAVRLVRQIPYTVACDLLLTGRHITAAEAKEMGLIGYIVPDGQALTKALEIAERHREQRPAGRAGDPAGDPRDRGNARERRLQDRHPDRYQGVPVRRRQGRPAGVRREAQAQFQNRYAPGSSRLTCPRCDILRRTYSRVQDQRFFALRARSAAVGHGTLPAMAEPFIGSEARRIRRCDAVRAAKPIRRPPSRRLRRSGRRAHRGTACSCGVAVVPAARRRRGAVLRRHCTARNGSPIAHRRSCSTTPSSAAAEFAPGRIASPRTRYS